MRRNLTISFDEVFIGLMDTFRGGVPRGRFIEEAVRQTGVERGVVQKPPSRVVGRSPGPAVEISDQLRALGPDPAVEREAAATVARELASELASQRPVRVKRVPVRPIVQKKV